MYTFTLYDVLEQLYKQRVIDSKLLNLVRPFERVKLDKIISMGIDRGYLVEEGEKLLLLDALNLLAVLISEGIDPSRFTEYIDWKEFENFVAQILQDLGYEVYLDYQHKGFSRFQIDVLALDTVSRIALVIECKHWKRLSRRSIQLLQAVSDHIKRVDKLNRYCEWVVIRIPKLRRISRYVPMIALIKTPPTKIINGVPLVSIYELNDFINNLHTYLEELKLYTIENKCYVA